MTHLLAIRARELLEELRKTTVRSPRSILARLVGAQVAASMLGRAAARLWISAGGSVEGYAGMARDQAAAEKKG